MALFQNLRERYAQRQEQALVKQKQQDELALFRRKSLAVAIESGEIVSIERNIERLQLFNYDNSVPPSDIWEYFNFHFPHHGTQILGWHINGFSFFAVDQEEILRLAGLLDRAYEGEKIVGHFDAEGRLVAITKPIPNAPLPPTALQPEE